MKNKIVVFLLVIFIIGCLPISNVASLSIEDKPYFYDVQIDKKGEILGDGDTINVSCKLANSDINVDDCICWINTCSYNIYFPLYYNEATGRYEGSYTFGETYDNPQRACYIMMIESYKNKITTYCNEDTHPLGMHEFYYCNKCKDGIHYPVTDEAKEPTCTEEGITEGIHCSLCSTVIKSQEIVPANEHTYTAVKTAPTCDHKGYTTYTCSCGEFYKGDYVVSTGHSYGEWIVVKEATTNSEGKKTRTCSLCGEVETHKIPKIDQPIEEPSKDICGDVNGDGVISAVDARIVLQTVAGLKNLSETEYKRADVNGDGVVTAVDARMILQIVAGLR